MRISIGLSHGPWPGLRDKPRINVLESILDLKIQGQITVDTEGWRRTLVNAFSSKSSRIDGPMVLRHLCTGVPFCRIYGLGSGFPLKPDLCVSLSHLPSVES